MDWSSPEGIHFYWRVEITTRGVNYEMLKTALDVNYSTGGKLETTQDANYSIGGMLKTGLDVL